MGRHVTETSFCAYPGCPTLVSSVTEDLADVLDDIKDGHAVETVISLIRSQAARDHHARMLKIFGEDSPRARHAHEVVVRMAMELADRFEGAIDLDSAERTEVSYVVDEGRSSGPPEDCYPSELVTDPECSVCGEECIDDHVRAV